MALLHHLVVSNTEHCFASQFCAYPMVVGRQEAAAPQAEAKTQTTTKKPAATKKLAAAAKPAKTTATSSSSMGGWNWNFGTSKNKPATPPKPKPAKAAAPAKPAEPAKPAKPAAAGKEEAKMSEEKVKEPETATTEEVRSFSCRVSFFLCVVLVLRRLRAFRVCQFVLCACWLPLLIVCVTLRPGVRGDVARMFRMFLTWPCST